MRTKSPDIHKRAIHQVKGLIVEWEDAHPLERHEGRIQEKCGHRNFVYRAKANQIWKTIRGWVSNAQTLRWLITITLIFRDQTVGEADEERETITLSGTYTISGINDTCKEAIKSSIEEIGPERFKTSHFHLECFGI